MDAPSPLRKLSRREVQNGGSGKPVIRTGDYHKTVVERLKSLGNRPGKVALWRAVNSFC